jgi:hypothetical protein
VDGRLGAARLRHPDRKLIVNEAEAAHIQFIFERFARIGSMTKLIPILAAEGIKAKSGKPLEKGYLYWIITNPVRTPALLKGLIFGPSGTAMTPSHTRRKGKLYRITSTWTS